MLLLRLMVFPSQLGVRRHSSSFSDRSSPYVEDLKIEDSELNGGMHFWKLSHHNCMRNVITICHISDEHGFRWSEAAGARERFDEPESRAAGVS